MGNATEREGRYHHPNYVGIWALLVVLLVVGIAVGFVGHVVLSTILVFSVAAIKASLVAANYMHLKSEPRFVQVIVLAALACVVIALIAFVPDIVYVYGG